METAFDIKKRRNIKITAIFLSFIAIWPISIPLTLVSLSFPILYFGSSYKFPDEEEAINTSFEEIKRFTKENCDMNVHLQIRDIKKLDVVSENSRYQYFAITQKAISKNGRPYIVYSNVYSYLVIGFYKFPNVEIMAGALECREG